MGTEAAALKKEKFDFEALVISLGSFQSGKPVSKAYFVALSERFPQLRIERESNGKIIVMSPVKKGTGEQESMLHGLLFMWNYQKKLGKVYGPSSGFDLPDGATKSPDVAWISAEKLAASTVSEQEEFIKIIPDFVAEVRSSSDRLKKLQLKMTDTWMKNGVRLAWLIDPYKEKVTIYRQGQEPEIMEGFSDQVLSGENVLKGFELSLNDLKTRLR